MGNTQTNDTKTGKVGKIKVKGIMKIRGKKKQEEAHFDDIISAETDLKGDKIVIWTETEKLSKREEEQQAQNILHVEHSKATDSWYSAEEANDGGTMSKVQTPSSVISSESNFTDAPQSPQDNSAPPPNGSVENFLHNLTLNSFKLNEYRIKHEEEKMKKLNKLGVSKTSQISLECDPLECFETSEVHVIRKMDTEINLNMQGGPRENKRHMSVPEDVSDQARFQESGVLKKVTSLSLSRADLESKISKPKFVPEKLDFQLYEKFEGHMLINWYVSELSDNHPLGNSLSEQEFKLLAVQFCTHLLAAGVLKQLRDKDVPVYNVFKPDCIYYWTYAEIPQSIPQTPGRISMVSWPPNSPTTCDITSKSLVDEIVERVEDHSSSENDLSPPSTRRRELSSSARDVEILALEEEIRRLRQEVEKYKTLIDIQALTDNAVKDFSSPLDETKTFESVCDKSEGNVKKSSENLVLSVKAFSNECNNKKSQTSRESVLKIDAECQTVFESNEHSNSSQENIFGLKSTKEASEVTSSPTHSAVTAQQGASCSLLPAPPQESISSHHANNVPPSLPTSGNVYPSFSTSEMKCPPPPPPLPTAGNTGPPPPPLPTAGNTGPPPPPLPTTGNIVPPPSPLPTTGNIVPSPPPLPTTGNTGPPLPPFLTTGNIVPPPPPLPTTGNTVPPPPPLPTTGNIVPPPPPLPISGNMGPPPPPPMLGPSLPAPPMPPPLLPICVNQKGPPPLPTPPPGGWTAQKAALRKNPLSPRSPMKPLYWTRIITPGVQEGPNSALWNEIDELSADSLDEFSQLFSRQVVTRKPAAAKKVKQKEKMEVVKLLDSKRSQNVGILAQSLHIDFQEIENAIYNFDTSMVSLESLQQIYEARGTPDEIDLIKTHLLTKPDVPLDKPEMFLHELSEIANFAERISCLMFMVEFEDSVNTISHTLANIKTTSEFLVSSRELKNVLAIILTLGNYMNGGNVTRGQADGFGLEILGKLKDVKSNDSKITLLHYIVRMYLKSVENPFDLNLPVPQPEDIRRAASVNFDEVKIDLQKLEKQLEGCEMKSKKVIENAQPENLQPFKDKMTTFLEHSKKQLIQEHENLEECRSEFIQTMKFYLFKPKTGTLDNFPPNSFFELWLSFCIDFKDIFKKELLRMESEKIKEIKKKEIEMKSSIVRTKERQNGLKAKVKRYQEKLS